MANSEQKGALMGRRHPRTAEPVNDATISPTLN